MSASASARARWALAAAAALAVALRLAGLGWGLPNTPNADEPHLVNLAVSFGGGSLKPYALKYPTLWPYVLFAAYGLYFLVWSALGLRRGLADFVGLFAWEPTGFYLIARALSAALSLGGAWLILKEEEEQRGRGAWPWAALLLAFAPVIVDLAHSAKPDCLMLFCVCLGWRHALRVLRSGRRADHWLSGAGFGLAMASQYTAAPACATLVACHLLSRARPRRAWLLEGTGAAALALFVGSPYVVLELPRVLDGMRDMGALMAMREYRFGPMLAQVLANAFSFAGSGSVAGLALLAGVAVCWRADRRRAAALAAPVLLYIALLASYRDGGWTRYLMGCFPGLALLASEGLEWARRRLGQPWAGPVLAALAVGPGAALSAAGDLRMRLADTRAEAAAIVRARVPEGATILLDVPHASPDLAMTRAQVEELAERTAAAGSPRARLYRGMARAHPGGGYRILRVKRTARDLASGPRHVELSQADAPMLDVAEGLAALRRAGVSYVVTSSFGATRATLPELSRFFDELEREGRLLAVVAPEEDRSAGPLLRLYQLKAGVRPRS
jgi:hypothetical protein